MKRFGMIVAVTVAVVSLFAAEPVKSRVVLKQGFEDPEFFAKVNSNRYTTGPAEPQGKWFAVTKDMIVKDQVLEGEYSLKVPRLDGKKPIPAICFRCKPGESGTFTCWLYREKGQNFCLQFRGRDAQGKPITIATAGAWDKNRQWAYWDAEKKLANGKKGGYVRSGKKFPAEEWIKVTLKLDGKTGEFTFSYGDSDSLTVLCKGKYSKEARLDSLWFQGMKESDIGASTYMDNVEYVVEN